MTSLAKARGDNMGTAPSAEAIAPRTLPRSVVETMDVPENGDLTMDIEEGIEVMKAGRAVTWNPKNVPNTKSE